MSSGDHGWFFGSGGLQLLEQWQQPCRERGDDEYVRQFGFLECAGDRRIVGSIELSSWLGKRLFRRPQHCVEQRTSQSTA
ncbi:MAG: hypothetical protein M3Y77_22475 [Actinomycetota bacterium]|nr:hypothetical protein [Actinomycetota bacterium]